MRERRKHWSDYRNIPSKEISVLNVIFKLLAHVFFISDYTIVSSKIPWWTQEMKYFDKASLHGI